MPYCRGLPAKLRYVPLTGFGKSLMMQIIYSNRKQTTQLIKYEHKEGNISVLLSGNHHAAAKNNQ